MRCAMNMKFFRITILPLLFGQPALADFELTAPDGRRVLLNDDQTWEYIAQDAQQAPASGQQAQPPRAVLSVSHVDEVDGGHCRMGVVLQNDLSHKIKNLAIRFTVYKSNSLPSDSVTRSFSEIKPTDSQYRNLLFRGIRCSAIHHIKVEDPGRCAMGDLDRFSAQPGDCLEHIRVVHSEFLQIGK